MVCYNYSTIGNHKIVHNIRGGFEIKISYKTMWKFFVEKDMMKNDLQAKAQI